MSSCYTGLAAVTAAVPFTFAVVAIIGLGAVVFTAGQVGPRKRGTISSGSAADSACAVTISATVRQKRTDLLGKHFYVIFETADGEQLELRVYEQDYGHMTAGDTGKLLYLGERFLGFYRV